ITELQLLIDERPYPGAEGLFRPDNPADKVTHTFKVKLAPGPHQVRVLARTRSSLGTSRGMVRETDEKPPSPAKPNLYFLAAGVDAYPAPDDLKGAVNDATKLEAAFKDHSKNLFGTIETNRLPEAKTKKAGILEGLDWLKGRMTAKDVGVFFFAGHGCRDE